MACFQLYDLCNWLDIDELEPIKFKLTKTAISARAVPPNTLGTKFVSPGLSNIEIYFLSVSK